MQDFQLARALTQPARPIEWHLIRIGSAGAPLIQAIDTLTIAPSLVRAFAGLQYEMDHARVFAHAVTHIDQGIGLLARDGGLIAAIEPVALQPPDLVKRECVSALIEGLRIHRDWISLTQRLSSLRGLKNLECRLVMRDEDYPSEAMGIASVRNQCLAMQRMLSEFHGIEVEPPDAQALVATALGAVDWETYIAKRDTAPEFLVPAALVHWVQTQPITPARMALYPTLAEAIFAFAQFCEHAAPAVIPVFSGVTRTGHCYGPLLQAEEAPPEQGPVPQSRSYHRCSYLSLLNSDEAAQARAHTHLAVNAPTLDRAMKFFLDQGSNHDRLRASNRRLGISSSQELLLGDWLFTVCQSETPSGHFLTIEKFLGDSRLLSETFTLHKSVCVRETGARWCHIAEDGKEAIVLEGLTEKDVNVMASTFGMSCVFGVY